MQERSPRHRLCLLANVQTLSVDGAGLVDTRPQCRSAICLLANPAKYGYPRSN